MRLSASSRRLKSARGMRVCMDKISCTFSNDNLQSRLVKQFGERKETPQRSQGDPAKVSAEHLRKNLLCSTKASTALQNSEVR